MFLFTIEFDPISKPLSIIANKRKPLLFDGPVFREGYNPSESYRTYLLKSIPTSLTGRLEPNP